MNYLCTTTIISIDMALNQQIQKNKAAIFFCFDSSISKST